MLKNVSLAKYSTMRLGGKAAYLAEVHERGDIPNALEWAAEKKLPVIMIGGGSNIIWKDQGFKGLVLVNKIPGFSIVKTGDGEHFVKVGAGEDWDNVVARTVRRGLHGIEALSLIPGTAGGTPIQNVGAYGQDVSQTLESVEAYDTKTKQFVHIAAADCDFAYRSSRFKHKDRGRFYITSLVFCLTKDLPEPPFYDALQRYLDTMGITEYTPKIIREVVIAIRRSKLPDPAKVANNGSFFGNPVVSASIYKKLKQQYPSIKAWETPDKKYKIPAGWLLETAGYKGFHDLRTGMATWEHQALVLVNEKAKTTADLLAFRDRIIKEVHQKFGITLEQEPELLP